MEKCAQSMLLVQFCFARFALGNTGRTFTSFTWLSCVMMDRFFAAQCGIFGLGVEALPINTSGFPTEDRV